jgi:hypothetical protein
MLFGKTKNYNFIQRCEIPSSPNWFNLNTLSDDIDTKRLHAVLEGRLSLDDLAPVIPIEQSQSPSTDILKQDNNH